MSQAEEYCDVIIIGAGAAGIGAAKTIIDHQKSSSNNTLKVIIVEARDRIGGRTYTSDELQSGVGLDHGGKWIHGSTSPHNPIIQLAHEHNIATTVLPTTDDGFTTPFYEKQKRRIDMTRVVLMSSEGGGRRNKSSRIPNRKAYKASKLLFNQLCIDYGNESLIAPMKHTFSTDASYMDCFMKLVEVEEDEDEDETLLSSFDSWLNKKVQYALKAIAKGKHRLQVKQSGIESSESECSSESSSDESSSSSSDDDDADTEQFDNDLIRETIALLRLRIYRYFENYEGLELDSASLLHSYDGKILPGKNADIDGGFGKMIESVAAPFDIRCGLTVTSIDDTSSQGVLVKGNSSTVADGNAPACFVAKFGVIVTVPLGVLKKDSICFVPSLPDGLRGSIGRLTMCLMNKIEMLFPTQWWPDGVGYLSIATENKANFPSLCNIPWGQFVVEEDTPALLVCYATGAFAEQIENQTNDNIQREAVDILRAAFLDNGANCTGISSIPEPVRTNVTRWRADQYAGGSWTSFTAGSNGMKDVTQFQTFNSDSKMIFFAGEHTCDNSVAGLDIGTVHGAYISGQVAAEHLLKKTLE